MKYYITFNYMNQERNDKIIACIQGKHVERYWNKHKMPDIELLREYPLEFIQALHPIDIQQGIFFTAGIEAGNISELRIFQDERDILEVVND